jgi:hypothetical protein
MISTGRRFFPTRGGGPLHHGTTALSFDITTSVRAKAAGLGTGIVQRIPQEHAQSLCRHRAGFRSGAGPHDE